MEITITVGLLVAVVIALVEGIKQAGIVPAKLLPIIALVLGIAAGIVYSGLDIKMGILVGIFIGVSAIGTYSGTTNITEWVLSKKKV